MGYRRAKQVYIWGFVAFNLVGEMLINDVLTMDYVDVSYNIGVMVFMMYLLGLLLWAFLAHHYTAYLLTKTTLKSRDVKTIFIIVGCQKMSKNVTYPEFNEIIENAYAACLRKMVAAEDEILDMVIACACVIYRQQVVESHRGGLSDICRLENKYYDFIKIAESLYNYSK